MIIKEIADRVLQTRVVREKTLRRKQAWSLALGVTIGSTLGVAAGFLFAPKAGKETRADLARLGYETWGKVQENASLTGQRLVSAVEETSSRVRTAAEKHVDAAKGALKELSREDEVTDKKK